MSRSKSVLVSVCNQHWIHKAVVHVLLNLVRDTRYKLRLVTPSHKPYENNLHHVVRTLLDEGHDYWLNIDSDNPPTSNPLDLIELDKDIIGLPTPIWHAKNKLERPVYWNAYKYLPEADAYQEYQERREGLKLVDAIGTGCFVAARRVFEHPEMQKGCFVRKLQPDGRVHKGNDISFCERAREVGFEIYAHFDYLCDHFHELSIAEVHNSYMTWFSEGFLG